MIPFVLSETTLTIFVNNEPQLVESTHINWRKLKALITKETATSENITELLDTTELFKKGVYYIFFVRDHMFCRYAKEGHPESTAQIQTFRDFDKCRNEVLENPIPEDATHTGTYSSLDDLLTDYAERFI